MFLSETIRAQENGSRGPHFAKSLNSNFLKGLTYSAMKVDISYEVQCVVLGQSQVLKAMQSG